MKSNSLWHSASCTGEHRDISEQARPRCWLNWKQPSKSTPPQVRYLCIWNASFSLFGREGGLNGKLWGSIRRVRPANACDIAHIRELGRTSSTPHRCSVLRGSSVWWACACRSCQRPKALGTQLVQNLGNLALFGVAKWEKHTKTSSPYAWSVKTRAEGHNKKENNNWNCRWRGKKMRYPPRNPFCLLT